MCYWQLGKNYDAKYLDPKNSSKPFLAPGSNDDENNLFFPGYYYHDTDKKLQQLCKALQINTNAE